MSQHAKIWYLSQNYAQIPLINTHIDAPIVTRCVYVSQIGEQRGLRQVWALTAAFAW